jgi:hypothetical protein
VRENRAMRRVGRGLLVGLCVVAFFLSAVSALAGESCKSTCTGGPNYAHALIWLATGLVALVGAVLLRSKEPESSDW